MQRSVAALIRASRVSGGASAHRLVASRRRIPALSRIAAAALLIAAGLAMQPVPEQSLPFQAAGGALAAAELPSQPLIDELDLAEARVYELGSDDVAVVMVVDSTLDV